jgi:hypothetical protein
MGEWSVLCFSAMWWADQLHVLGDLPLERVPSLASPTDRYQLWWPHDTASIKGDQGSELLSGQPILPLLFSTAATNRGLLHSAFGLHMSTGNGGQVDSTPATFLGGPIPVVFSFFFCSRARWPRGTLYPQKLALTSPTSVGRYSSLVD